MSRSLKKNYLYQATWQLLLITVPLITTPYLSRVLGAEQVGVYSYTYAITNYFVMFATLGMSTYGVRLIALCGNDRAKRSREFWSAYGSQLLIGVIVMAAYVGYSFLESRGGWQVSLMWGMWVLSALFDISWLLFGVEEFKIPTIRSIATKIISVLVILLFVKEQDDLWIYCAAIAGSFLANQLLIWPFLRRYVDFSRPTMHDIVHHIAPNIRLFIPVIAISFYISLDKIMLGIMTDMTQTGYFEYSEKLSKLPLSLITAMGTVMLPRMTSELNHGHKEEALGLLENSIWAMLAAAFAMMFGIMAIAPEFAVVFLGEEFASCDSIMFIIALTIPAIATTNVLGRQYLLPTGRDKMFTTSVCIGAVVNVLCNLILLPQFGAIGAAISTVIAEYTVLFVQVGLTRKELPLLTYLKNSVPFAVCGCIMFGVVRFASQHINVLLGVGVASLVLEIVAGVASFLVLALVWCLVTKDRHIGILLRNLKLHS